MKIIIVGGGQVGSYLASLMLKNGNTVTIVENRNKKSGLVTMENPGAKIVLGSGSDPDVLEEAGIEQADVVAAVTGEDETNLVVSTLAKIEYGVPRVVSRVNNPKNAWLYTLEMGVDVGLNQADLIAHLVEEEASIGDLVALTELAKGRYTVVEETVKTGHRVRGMTLGEVILPENCLISGIIREGILLAAQPELVILAGDMMVGICASGMVDELSEILEKELN